MQGRTKVHKICFFQGLSIKRRKPTQYSGLGEWLKPTDFDSVEETPRQFESDSRCGIIWEPSRGDTVFTNPKAKLIIIEGTDNGEI